MPLASGAKLGPYEIQSPLGAGGMGEVYRARDTRLDRIVAIKVLNAQLVASSELRARLDREARIISQLQHPNICVLHDVGREGSIDYLVMEYLQGESLAERLRHGPLPPEQVLTIAIEIADALERAHRAGVVHRDLKPGNVMLTKSGAKLLDFGLAKPVGATVAAGSASGLSPSVFAAALTNTLPVPSPASPLSAAGAVIGTVQYMSPEQIQGVEADARSDIFSFGVMLFEMVTGKRTFDGKTQASIVGQILAVDPPSVRMLRPETPPGLDRVIRLCLEKDPDERIQTAHDLKLQMQGIAEMPRTATDTAAAAPARWPWLPWIAVAVCAVAALWFAFAWYQSLRASQVSVHSYILPPDKAAFVLSGTSAGPPVLSPDGLRVAFVAKDQSGQQMLWIRPMNSAVAHPMPGTEGASYPFWSPDSRYVGFFTTSKLNKIEAAGGPPQALCNATSGRGGAWSKDGVIVFAPDAGGSLERVDSGGGAPVALTTLPVEETSHRWPQFLPDGRHFLFFSHGATRQQSAVYLASLDGNERKLLLRNESNAIYAPPGYLLFVRDNALLAQRFNLAHQSLEGEAQPIADHVEVNADVYQGTMSASSNGELLYQHGEDTGGSELISYDAAGQPGQPLLPEKAEYTNPRLSPDSSKLSVAIEANGASDIWVLDLTRHTKTRITFGSQFNSRPVWWPDGKSIFYSRGPWGAPDSLVRQNADGTGAIETLLQAPGVSVLPFSISSDGRYLAFMRRDLHARTGWDIWAMPTFGDRKPFPVVGTPFSDITPAISPDGKWLAYSTDDTGRYELYIQPFPSGAGRWQVSTSGGAEPAWRSDGRELFYAAIENIMAVDVKPNGNALELGTPRVLFKASTVPGPSGPFTVSSDGKKFVLNAVTAQAVTEPFTLVTNWTADLKQ